jgi:hypothetical protein
MMLYILNLWTWALPALLYQRDSNPARYAAGRILPLRVVGGSSIMEMIAILALWTI